MTVTDLHEQKIDRSRALMGLLYFASKAPAQDAECQIVISEFVETAQRLAAEWGMSDDLEGLSAGLQQCLGRIDDESTSS